jgi:hypothetical protein
MTNPDPQSPLNPDPIRIRILIHLESGSNPDPNLILIHNHASKKHLKILL